MSIIAVAGDIHSNSTVAVCPYRVRLDDGGEYVASESQRWLWRQWVAFWREIGERRATIGGPLFIILNGEIADDNHHFTTQLITRNPADQLKTALQVLEPVIKLLRDGDRVFVIRGTEAHSGPSAALDETIAREIGAEPCTPAGPVSWWQMKIEVDGLRLDVAHHPPGGGGRRPWTAANYPATLAAMSFYESAAQKAKPAHLMIRGHVHRPGDSYDAHPVRALILPSWQLSTAYGYRIGGGLLPIGGAWIETAGRGRYEVHKRFTNWQTEGFRAY